ncbi:class I SAM-dependent methyltransferase [Anaerocolumna xylanovorans]|uniref:Methyltransferase domain-containing protein n=1 Tax=Anaerocolumna xylanovorans DSM 12503 TaxID=1121345 RepID=A0A1M7YG16_9FIRM|nr:class I SAM-dependent methyltransferase [Anaerocolumna xylanovorans]SHO51582.1 Methyltransferase domain-containing protein [Anaerocolumna xylanovorans DSM 12503]
MNDLELMEYLLKEEQHAFQGWDFTYLDSRWESEMLSWDYTSIINKYRKPTDILLDMGTGGGEFILYLGHPYPLISVTEGYQPNLRLCRERLEPLGITVRYVGENDKLDYPDEQFDLVINRHESFDASEVYRVLKPGGYFITQQVGGQNDRELVEKLLGQIPLPFPHHDLQHNVELLQGHCFTVLEQMEEMPLMKLFDLGAVVYFAKQIVWEFPDFSARKYFDQIKALEKERKQKGYISNREHRFLIVARKN